jgi:hypothetical protein
MSEPTQTFEDSPALLPVEPPAPTLGELLGDDLDDALLYFLDVLGQVEDATHGHPDPGKGPVLRAKVGRCGEAVKLLVRRLQAEVEALTY